MVNLRGIDSKSCKPVEITGFRKTGRNPAEGSSKRRGYRRLSAMHKTPVRHDCFWASHLSYRPLHTTSFLINIGMTAENVINFFRSISDFDERMPRYQVEHIAEVRGSRTKYIPPRCDTLRTHGICPSTMKCVKGYVTR